MAINPEEFAVTIEVTVDISDYLKIFRFAQKNRKTIVRLAAERYVRWLRKRYISLSAGGGSDDDGGGTWPELADETIERKIRRKIAKNPHYILREGDDMMDAIDMEERADGTYVGYVDEGMDHPRSSMSMVELVVHHAGTGRDAIARPSNTIRKRMADDVRKEWNKMKRKYRRADGRKK